MTELLERWARLEPERCGISEQAAHLGKSFAFRIHWAVLGADPINLAVVLAAVIEAIEERDAKAVKHNADGARGHDLHEWRYSLGGHSEETWAEVWSGLPMTVGRSYRAESREPAAALLGAYLAALEAADADEPETARFTAALKAENETLRAAVLGIANTLRDTDGE